MDRSYGIIPLVRTGRAVKVLLVRLHSGKHWSFPKGHAESGESAKEAAARELFEETGLKVESYLSDDTFSETYFFQLNGKLIHKSVDYFIAEVKGDPVIQEQEISAFVLVDPKEVSEWLTHKESKKVWEEALSVLGFC